MENIPKSVPSRVFGSIKVTFIAGLVVVIPLAVTYLILSWVFNMVDGIFRPLIIEIFGRSFPGIGIIAMLLLIYFLGVLTFFLPGRKTIEGALSLLLKTPLIKDIYGVSAQIVGTIAQTDESPFKRVVLVDYPRTGTKSLGFVTGRVPSTDGKEWVCVFIPSTPNPTQGNLIVVEADQVTETTLTTEAALKMVMSAGMMIPQSFKP